jgi:hypothetical protein
MRTVISLTADAVSPLSAINNLRDRIALKLVCEFSSGQLVLLASKEINQGIYKSRGYSPCPINMGSFDTPMVKESLTLQTKPTGVQRSFDGSRVGGEDGLGAQLSPVLMSDRM